MAKLDLFPLIIQILTIFEVLQLVKKMTDTLPQIKFEMLPVTNRALSIENVAIIDDNFEPVAGARPKNQKFPFKVLMGLSIFCVEGAITMRLNQKEYILKKNDLLVALPGFIMEHIEFTPKTKTIMAATATNLFGKSPMKSNEYIRKWLLRQDGPAIIHIPDEISDDFINTYKTFRKFCSYIDNEFLIDEMIGLVHSFMSVIATIIKNTFQMDESVELSRKKGLMVKFINDVHEYCNKERSVSFYAGRCYLSPKYFARIMTEMIGKKPGDVIKENVILESKVMLISHNYTVQQVSDKMNFPNSSFFCKYFKSATGCSPRQYQLYGEKAIDAKES